ncbi:MAG TPA: helix-turn-helix domain-containing protein [Solirubrobacterales bacterium]|jgi:transposase|nr:helix-turn-helix domain-containing protein [Solirubrobacterales bacterium]
MERELLEQCLAEGMSLETIGKRAGKHESTVSYWLKKYGLEAARAEKHAAKGGVSKEELERFLAAGISLREIARQTDRSLATIRHWMRKYGLETERSSRLRESKDACRQGSKTARLKCPKHGRSTFTARADGRFRCSQCRIEAVAKRRRSLKRILVEEAGGGCLLCGYSRCDRALEFHHLDPLAKQFQITSHTRSLARLRAEARKCALLCSNCHAEVEAGIAAVPLNSVPDADPG